MTAAPMNGNKLLLVEHTSFLLMCSRILELSADKPAQMSSGTIVMMLGFLYSLCSESL
jgi:5'-3' exonuclease